MTLYAKYLKNSIIIKPMMTDNNGVRILIPPAAPESVEQLQVGGGSIK